MGKLTVYLSKRFLAAHRQNRVAECDQNAEQAEHFGEILVEVRVFQEPKSFLTELEILRSRQRHGLIRAFEKCQHDQESRMTTITVVICMTRSAFSLDS